MRMIDNPADGEVSMPPDDTVAALAFSPINQPYNYLISGSWDNQVRCWMVRKNPATNQWTGEPKAVQNHAGPVLDVAWSDDGTKAFTASVDKTVKMWDLGSNTFQQVASHDAAVRTIHWIKAPQYSCVMTTSWDKTMKFWDVRQPTPVITKTLPERSYCADVLYPMAVVSTANRGIVIYKLDPTPTEYRTSSDSPLKFQHRCVSIFCDERKEPTGYAIGSTEGRVAVQYVQPKDPKSNFTFKCHRSNGTTSTTQDIYAVNDIAFHPEHGTMATVGSDGRYSFWDKDARTRLKMSDLFEQSVTRCCFNARGEVFAYAIGYDWSKGYEHATPAKKNRIFLHECYEDLKPKAKASTTR
ncbi:mRNA export factor, partial [Fragariocoptes setiger]